MVLIISEVEIGQMALSHVGDNTNIESFDDDTTAAGQIKIWYNPARVKTLASYDWSFARTRQTLAVHGDAAPSDWAYRYQYPADCVKFRRIVSPGGARNRRPPPYKVLRAPDDTRSIVSNLASATGEFTGNVISPDFFTMHFTEALSYQLAFYIAWPLTKKVSVQNAQLANFRKALAEASVVDANEEEQDEPPDAPHIAARA